MCYTKRGLLDTKTRISPQSIVGSPRPNGAAGRAQEKLKSPQQKLEVGSPQSAGEAKSRQSAVRGRS